MSVEPRLVECRKCGYQWESSAKDPRCSDPNDVCNRARADPVHQDDPAAIGRTDTESQDGGASDDSESDSWTPRFETSEPSVGSDDPPEPPTMDSSDGDSSEDGQKDGPQYDMPDLEAEDVRPFLVSIFGGPPTANDEPVDGMLSSSRGEHWQLKDHELDNLGRAYARVGNKYLPYFIGEYTVEAMAVMTTASIVMPRIHEDRRKAKEDEEPNVQANEGGERNPNESEETDDESLARRDSGEGWTAGQHA